MLCSCLRASSVLAAKLDNTLVEDSIVGIASQDHTSLTIHIPTRFVMPARGENINQNMHRQHAFHVLLVKPIPIQEKYRVDHAQLEHIKT